MRDLRYILKRVIILTLVAILVMFFKSKVSFAATIESLQIDYSNISNSTYYYRNANQESIFNFIGMGTESPDENLYVNTLFCVLIDGGAVPTGIAWANANDPQSFTGWGTRNSITTNITNVPCTLAGTSYRGKVVQVTGITRTGQDGGGDIYYTFRLSVNQNYSISLLNYSIANVPYELIVSQTDYTSQLNDMSNAITTTINNMSTIINNSLNNNQAQTNQWLQKVEAAQKAMKEAMESDAIEENNQQFSEFNSYLAQNGVITNLITMPVTLFSKVLTTIDGTCVDYDLGTLYDSNLILPCIDVSDYLGDTLWGVIDVIISGLLVYSISRHFVKMFNKMSSLEESDIID